MNFKNLFEKTKKLFEKNSKKNKKTVEEKNIEREEILKELEDIENIPSLYFYPAREKKPSDAKTRKKSKTFWREIFLGFSKNKLAFTSLLVFMIIFILSFILPLFSQIGAYEQVRPVKTHSLLPPRIPIIEKFGILNGTRLTEISETALENYSDGDYKILKEEYVLNSFGKKEKRIKILEYSYVKNKIENKYFIFGTDEYARDIFTRVWHGTFNTLIISLLAVLFSVLLGFLYGASLYIFNSKLSFLLEELLFVLDAIPRLVGIILYMLLFGDGALNLCIAIILTGWINIAKMIRKQIKVYGSRDFVLAAKALGSSKFSILKKHILPNIYPQLITNALFSMNSAVFTEVFLSQLGLGFILPEVSIGSIIAEAKPSLNFYPSKVFIPAAMFAIIILSINLFSDGLKAQIQKVYMKYKTGGISE